ncbi:hypothetical protein K7X08_018336 [Anisodus acutangulus]|uniref:GDP-mannose 4,6-dehydratase n=1 Tax=Anisodus acutangulus TaxID=402998 RepID=A0A9Q1LVH6_9SOLA|nr:hypothetical protein K7X08_018336 [Anisodus acutangulus]
MQRDSLQPRISSAGLEFRGGREDNNRVTKHRRDWGFAGDYVEAMWMMLQQEKPDDYVVATEDSHTVEEFLEVAFGYVGLNWREMQAKRKKVLGWKPKVGFEQLVKMMVDEDVELAKTESSS